MKTVSAREANQGFSKLLAEVTEGEDVVITRRGEPVARLVPYKTAAWHHPQGPARDKAVAELMEHLRNAPKMNIGPWTRDEAHER